MTPNIVFDRLYLHKLQNASLCHIFTYMVCSCPCFCAVHLLQMSMLLYSLMPTLGGHGSAGVKHAENWSASMKRLMNSVHETLNELYEQVPTGA